MLERPIITLTTDFGIKDPFVGIMKGIILGINPSAQIIDITHTIDPQNIIEAANVVSMGYKYFSPTSIHVVVVDPQVGSARRPILVVTDDHYFIGPDNGVFSSLYEEKDNFAIFKVLHITASHYFLPPKGSTFHGRDIFAPSAAWLSKGVESVKFGDEINDYTALTLPKVQAVNEKAIEGTVVHFDGFGNAITNIINADMQKINPEMNIDKFQIIYKDIKIGLSNYYSETSSQLSAVINSFGFLELFTYKGKASDKFGIKIGDKVSVMVI
ncbi:MAG: SAM-dependent chlorinase/fluorinase [Nitrospirae bacterium]|nr:SAM-dependent chlorinase/fluorinase [Nitrospirota bacterium]